MFTFLFKIAMDFTKQSLRQVTLVGVISMKQSNALEFALFDADRISIGQIAQLGGDFFDPFLACRADTILLGFAVEYSRNDGNVNLG